MLALCLALRDKYSIAAVTNDIFTKEDQEFLVRHNALPTPRIRAIETGGCPHAAVREDISTNLGALEELHAEFDTQLLLIESGGDNLAANYSRELADFIIYVVCFPPKLFTHFHTKSDESEETWARIYYILRVNLPWKTNGTID